jgi:2-polyprenyl-6-methoxyphenol hydroxylase-like FAD-dependent oxidoreductase
MPKSLTGDVAIVGGSLAGLATGIGLARRGLPVDVFEQNAGEERGGTGLGVDRILITETTGVDARVDGLTHALTCDDGVAHLSGPHVNSTAAVIIGADGYRSQVRRAVSRTRPFAP